MIGANRKSTKEPTLFISLKWKVGLIVSLVLLSSTR